MFKIMRRIGHAILTWDEEALVHLPRTFITPGGCPGGHPPRFSPFCWVKTTPTCGGVTQAAARSPHSCHRQPPQRHAPAGTACVLRRSGESHPREIRRFHPGQHQFQPRQRLFPARTVQAGETPGETPQFGKAGVGMSRPFAEALRDHKQAVFEAFQRLIRNCRAHFPGCRSLSGSPDRRSGRVPAYRFEQRARSRHERGQCGPWLLSQKPDPQRCTTGWKPS